MAVPQKRFQVALSFPGEKRTIVKPVADHLAAIYGKERVLYDKYHEAEFAQPDLDVLLQELYHDQSELIVVFLCAVYNQKDWCGLEWRAIRDLIKQRHLHCVMLLRFDNSDIPGLYSIDGYVEIGDRSPEEIGELIIQRLRINTERNDSIGASSATSEAGIPPLAVTRGDSKEETERAMHHGITSPSTSDDYEDGTNIPRGTPFYFQSSRTTDWYLPSKSKASTGWKERWARLRERFEQIIDQCRPMSCVLIEKRIPAYPRNNIQSWLDVVPGGEFVQCGGGLRCEPSFLYTRERMPLFGKFPIRDAYGTPIRNSAGEAFGFRFGLSRQIFFYSEQNDLRESRTFPEPHLFELASDGTGLIYQLPSNVATSLWRNWRVGFSRGDHSDEYLWLDVLFELSWQRKPGDVLYTTRHAWLENRSIQLEGQGLFPRLPDMSVSPASVSSIPADNGYPVTWKATISDVARASVIAIDELLERAGDTS